MSEVVKEQPIPSLSLRLFHGRRHPGDVLEDWGSDGPVLEGITSMHVTYLDTYVLSFVDYAALERARALTGWEIWCEESLEIRVVSDLLVTIVNDIATYYGDWSLSVRAPTAVAAKEMALV